MSADDSLLVRLQQMRDDCYTFARDTSALDDAIRLLSASFPCGWPEPEVRDGRIVLHGVVLTRDEALGIAAAIIRAATQIPGEE